MRDRASPHERGKEAGRWRGPERTCPWNMNSHSLCVWCIPKYRPPPELRWRRTAPARARASTSAPRRLAHAKALSPTAGLSDARLSRQWAPSIEPSPDAPTRLGTHVLGVCGPPRAQSHGWADAGPSQRATWPRHTLSRQKEALLAGHHGSEPAPAMPRCAAPSGQQFLARCVPPKQHHLSSDGNTPTHPETHLRAPLAGTTSVVRGPGSPAATTIHLA